MSLGEAALLVALPQSPEARRPDRSAEAARAARDRVLDRFAATGGVPADEIALAKAEPVPAGAPPDADARAACRRPGRRRRVAGASEVRLTIDAELQKSLEELARERARTLALTLGPDVSLAMLVDRQRHRRSAARMSARRIISTRAAPGRST